MKEKKDGKNFYKLGFLGLLGILFLGLVVYGFTSYTDSRYQSGFLDGQNQTINVLLGTIANSGSVTIGLPEGSVTLVPSQAIQVSQEQVILEILNRINSEGFVTLFNEDTQVTLVQAQTQETQN